MKRILITGENSYIGTSFAEYMEQFEEEYLVETISVKGDEWKHADFSVYDVVYHVAGIAHRKETKENRQLYFDVNFELTKLVANKAKKDGVKQFIFLSSMSVYGLTEGIINEQTKIKPKTSYGKSKFAAEQFLETLKEDNFKVCILRPPMVYGRNCLGNYQQLKKIAMKLIFVPNYKNERSMIYIENLSKVIKNVIDGIFDGIMCPQNNEYVATSDMMNQIALNNNKKLPMIISANFFIIVLKKVPGKIGKLTKKSFGTLIYEKIEYNSDFINFRETIYETERVD